MIRGKQLPAVPGAVIALLAIALGFVSAFAGLHIVPGLLALLDFSHHQLLDTAALAAVALALAAVVLLHELADHQNEWVRELLSAFLDHIPDNVYFKDRQSRFVLISRNMAAYIGMRDPSEAIGKTDRDIFSSEHAERAMADEEEILRTGQPVVGLEEKETWPDGRETWVLTTKIPLRDRHGRIVGTMGISHNITDRRRAEAQVQHMALHDALTGLPNRVFLKNYLSQVICQAQSTGAGVTVMMLDLDHFKEVNDSMGHHAGDLLLESVARRLKSNLRENDFVARLGGDEFVLAFPAVGKDSHVCQIARKVLGALSEPFSIENRQLRVVASIGIAQFPTNGSAPEDLLHAADAAMYEAKAKGRGRFCLSLSAAAGGTSHAAA